MPEAVAGVPPDYFSETGQLWGNPLYRWERCEEEGYRWWIARVRAALEKCDLLRLDHFRGFSAYWAVPAGARTAAVGAWRRGPGQAFFDALRAALGSLPLLAENLGDIDEAVIQLLRGTGLPGMHVLQFASVDPESEHHVSHFSENSTVYTGTHDNDTTRGWFDSLPETRQAEILAAVGGDRCDLTWSMIRTAMESRPAIAVVPVQDLLDLGSAARMNLPATPEGNWEWRMDEGALRPELAERVRALLEKSERR
jgi:4-alpha-glucanotransferase